MPRSFLIDTDTASDDAVALIMALRHPDVRVEAITTVAGNVAVQQATRNALYTVELCGARTPVHEGAAQPLHRPLEDATWFHGRDGLGDQGFATNKSSAASGDAVRVIIDAAESIPRLELVTLGPLTNIALALLQKPSIAQKIERCVLMGGAPCCAGNVTPAAEYNIWTDPEAARVVFRSGMPIEMIGWHLCRHEAVLNPEDIARTLQIGTDLARFTVNCNAHARQAYLTQTGEDGISLPDPVCMSIALDRTIGTSWNRHRVEVSCESELTRGMTVVDQLNVGAGARNCAIWAESGTADICWTIDVPRWKDLLWRSVGYHLQTASRCAF